MYVCTRFFATGTWDGFPRETAELIEARGVTFVVASITVFIALMNSEDAKKLIKAVIR